MPGGEGPTSRAAGGFGASFAFRRALTVLLSGLVAWTVAARPVAGQELPDLVGFPTVQAPAAALPGATGLGQLTYGSRSASYIQTPVAFTFHLSAFRTPRATGEILVGQTLQQVPAGEQSGWIGVGLTIPSSTAGGTYFLHGRVDTHNVVVESDESNNDCSPLSIQILDGGEDRFEPNNTEESASMVTPGTYAVGLYAGDVDVFEFVPGAGSLVEVLVYGQSPFLTVVAPNGNVYTPVAQGVLKSIQFTADGPGGALVRYEGEPAPYTLTLQVKPLSEGRPNLSVRSSGAVVRTTSTGWELSCSSVILYDCPGPQKIPLNFDVSRSLHRFPDSTKYFNLTFREFFRQHPGELELTDTIPLPPLSPGTYLVRTLLTLKSNALEVEYPGNSGAARLEVPVRSAGIGAPDFVVSRLEFDRVDRSGSEYSTQVSVAIRNAGASEAGPSVVSLALSDDSTVDIFDPRVSELSVPTLPAGASAVVTGVFQSTPGQPSTAYVGAIADVSDQIAEADEANNAATRLAPDDHANSPDELDERQDVLTPDRGIVRAKMDLAGDIDCFSFEAAEARTHVVVVSTPALSGISATVLGPDGVSVKASAEFSAATANQRLHVDVSPPGKYFLKLQARGPGTGEYSVGVLEQLGFQADLSVVLDPGTNSSPAGQFLEVSVELTNLGGVDAPGFGRVQFRLSDHPTNPTTLDVPVGQALPEFRAVGLESSYLHERLLMPDIPPGIYYLRGTVDADEEIAEADEGNNLASVQIRLTPRVLPDIRAVVQLNSGTVLYPGQSTFCSLHVDVANSPRIVDGIVDELFLSASESPQATDARSLARSTLLTGDATFRVSRFTFEVPSDVPPGLYYLFARADIDDELAEADEGNNASPPVRIEIPALRPDSFEPNNSPESAARISPGTHAASLTLGDIDYYKFAVEAGTFFEVDVRPYGRDVRFQLTSTDGTTHVPTEYFRFQPIALTAPVSGTCQLSVWESPANYSFSVTLKPPGDGRPNLVHMGFSPAATEVGRGVPIHVASRVRYECPGSVVVPLAFTISRQLVTSTSQSSGYYLQSEYFPPRLPSETSWDPQTWLPPLSPGEYYLSEQLSPVADVVESSTDDNNALANLHVAPRPPESTAPDLSVSELRAKREVSDEGQVLHHLSARVTNIGTQTTSAGSVVLFAQSSDASISEIDTPIAQFELQTLATGDSEVVTAVFIGPPLYLPRSYIGILADPGDRVVEANEFNNAQSVPIGDDHPDERVDIDDSVDLLHVDGPAIPGSLDTNADQDWFAFDATSAGLAGLSLFLRLYSSLGIDVEDEAGSTLIKTALRSNGDRRYKQVLLDLPRPGRYYVKASRQDAYWSSYSVRAFGPSFLRPDLTASTRALVTTIPADSQFQIHFVVSNQGGVDTTAPLELEFRLSDSPTTPTTLDHKVGRWNVFWQIQAESAAEDVINAIAPIVPPGRYYLRTIVDPNNSIVEINESNNLSFVELHIGSREKPDLFLTELTGPDEAFRGQELELSVVLGSGPASSIASAFSIEATLSRSATPGTDEGHFLGRSVRSQFPQAGLDSISIGALLPRTLAAGDYFVHARVDPGNVVGESDEGNNGVTPIPLRVLPLSGDSLEPNEDVNSAAPIEPGTYALTLTQGDRDYFQFHAQAGSLVHAVLTRSPALNDLTLVAPSSQRSEHRYNPPDSESLQFTASTTNRYVLQVASGPVGPYTLRLWVSTPSECQLNLSVLSSSAVVLTTSTGRELACSSVIRYDCLSTQQIPLTFRVTRTLHRFTNSEEYFDLTGRELTRRNPGEVVVADTIALPPMPPGAYLLKTVVETGSSVLESSYSDNTMAVRLDVPAREAGADAPDLVVSSLTFDRVDRGEAVSSTVVRLEILNRGASLADPSVVSLALSEDPTVDIFDPRVVDVPVPSLATGASTIVTGVIHWVPEHPFVGGIADISDQVAEADETNNTTSTLHDLLPPAPPPPPSEPGPPVARAGDDQRRFLGDDLILSGEMSSDPTGLGLSYVWRQSSGPALGLGDVYSWLLRLAPERAGTYGFTLTVTDLRLRSSSDEVVVLFRNRGDVSVSHVTLSNSSAHLGEPLTLTYTVAADGDFLSATALECSIYIYSSAHGRSRPSLIGATVTTGIAPGSTVTSVTQITLPVDLDLGQHRVLVKLDPFDRYRESSEANNEAESPTFGVRARSGQRLLIASPARTGFGSVPVGTMATREVQIASAGSLPVRLDRVETDSSDFWLSSAIVFPHRLTPGAFSTLTVGCTPRTTGPAKGVLRVYSNADEVPLTATVSVFGVAGHLVVSPAGLQFGNVVRGLRSTRHVLLTNRGDAQLTISGVSFSSSTFSSDETLGGRVLNPGDSVELRVHAFPTDTELSSDTLRIYTNGFPQKITEVPLSAQGAAHRFSFDAGADAGRIRIGHEGSVTRTFRNSGIIPATISALRLFGASDFAITSAPALPWVVAPGGSVSVSIRFGPLSRGDRSTLLVAEVLGAPAQQMSTVSGTGIAPAGNLIGHGDLGSLLVGSSTESLFSLVNSGNDDLTLLALQLRGDGFLLGGEVDPGSTIPPGQSLSIPIRFSAGRAGIATGLLEVRTDDSARPLLRVDLSATASVPRIPWMRVSPPVLSFETVALGTARAVRLQVANDGSAPLAVTGISRSDARLSVNPDAPFEVLPGAARILEVTLTAGEVTGTLAAQLALESDDPAGTKLVLVEGRISKELFPVADAGEDLVTELGARGTLKSIRLDASRSRDPSGRSLLYDWSLSSSTSPGATLASPSSPQAELLASHSGVVAARVVVGVAGSTVTSEDTVTVTLSDSTNRPPWASAGLDRVVRSSSRPVDLRVQLFGRDSADPDAPSRQRGPSGDAVRPGLDFHWRVGTSPAGIGPAAFLDPGGGVPVLELRGNGANPTFVDPVVVFEELGRYRFDLVVAEASGERLRSATSSVWIEVAPTIALTENTPPRAVARALSPSTGELHRRLVLTAGDTPMPRISLFADWTGADGSSDRETPSSRLEFLWRQIGGPTRIDLSDPQSPHPSFALPEESGLGVYAFRVWVTDDGRNGPDSKPDPAGRLRSAGSNAVEVAFLSPTNASPVLTSVSAAWVDGQGTSRLAGIGMGRRVVIGGEDDRPVLPEVTLSAYAIDDGQPAESVLAYRWRQLPQSQTAPLIALEGQDTPAARFRPRVSGTYQFEATVTDGQLTASRRLAVAVDDLRPAGNSGVIPQVRVGRTDRATETSLEGDPGSVVIDIPEAGNGTVILDASGSWDADSSIAGRLPGTLTFRWSQLSGPESVEAQFTSSSLQRLTMTTSGVFEFAVAMDDGQDVTSLALPPIIVRLGTGALPSAEVSAVGTGSSEIVYAGGCASSGGTKQALPLADLLFLLMPMIAIRSRHWLLAGHTS